MKIGDKVRFISEKGGGVVVGFQNNNIAIVEDEDGFQVPTQVQDLVVVNDDKQAKMLSGATTPKIQEPDIPASHANAMANAPVAQNCNVPKALHVYERENSDQINLYLGFVPKDKQNISKTEFFMYLINDCNFSSRSHIHFSRETTTNSLRITSWNLIPNCSYQSFH